MLYFVDWIKPTLQLHLSNIRLLSGLCVQALSSKLLRLLVVWVRETVALRVKFYIHLASLADMQTWRAYHDMYLGVCLQDAVRECS